jgi:phage terminase large subunit GpA-like protein
MAKVKQPVIDRSTQLKRILSKYWQTLQQPQKLTVDKWADKYRYLSPESAAEPGRWHTSRVPYMQEILQTLTDPNYEILVFMASSQVSKTEGCGLNLIGYTIDQDPCPMLVVLPNLDDAKFFSKMRLSTMIRDTPVLRPKVKDYAGKGSRAAVGESNEVLSKSFPGGHVTLVGSNSPSGLASRPIRIVYFDELDRCEPAAGTEGDQVQLVMRRMETFWNRKLILTSTPGVRGISRIEKWYETSDQKKYFVPCPLCQEPQILEFAQLKWDTDETGEHDYASAYFECLHCYGKIEETHKPWMLEQGQWRGTADPESRRVVGFSIWAAYSPWKSWESIAQGFVEAKRQGVEELRAFTNTVLGESWEDEGQQASWQVLASRSEPIEQWVVPPDVYFLTAGVDIQLDRIEYSVWGWGSREESWLIGHSTIYGDPDTDATWLDMDSVIYAYWPQPGQNRELPLTAVCLDTGFKTQSVYRYVRGKPGLFAVKGAVAMTAPRVGRPSYQDITHGGVTIKDGLQVWNLGTNLLKQTLYSRFQLTPPGPRTVHFPAGLDNEYYKQLTAERLIRIYSKGKDRQEWKRMYRNEALDCAVYAYAGALIAGIERLDWGPVVVPENMPKPRAANLPAPGRSRGVRSSGIR